MLRGLFRMIVFAVLVVVIGYVVRYEAANWIMHQSAESQAAVAQKAAEQVPAAMDTAEKTVQALSPVVINTIQNIVETFAARVHAQRNTAAQEQAQQQTETVQEQELQDQPAQEPQQPGQFKRFDFNGGKR